MYLIRTALVAALVAIVTSAPVGKSGYLNRPYEGPGFNSAKYVLIIGIDGLGSYYLEHKPESLSIPNIEFLRKTGSWTYHTRAVLPTVSAPNWGSILSGAGPEEHGILDNDWVVGSELEPETGAKTYFPSIFQVVRDQTNAVKTAFYNDWVGFLQIFPQEFADFIYTSSSDPNGEEVTDHVIEEIIKPKKAQLMFLHFDDVDETGHEHGWGTPEYYRAVETCDRQVGRLLEALRDSGIYNDTLVIIVSDHGGEGRGHGQSDTLNLYTQLVLSGPGVRGGFELPCPTKGYSCYSEHGKNVRSLDVASTALYALGLRQHDLWIGRPLQEAWAL
eukprot:Colp12_sorted_trinity150504_noHs@22987